VEPACRGRAHRHWPAVGELHSGRAASITIETNGQPTATIALAGALPAGVSFRDDGDGTGTLSGTPTLGSGGVYPLTVTASNGIAPDAVKTLTLTVRYVFHGFFQPLSGGALNVVNAGRAIPVKFDLNGDQGLAVLAAGSPRSVPILCETQAPEDTVEQSAGAGTASLTYDAAANPPFGLYTYVWKTDKAWAGSCRRLQLTLVDGQTFTADFSFGG
jgi:hypothetical protein